MSKKEFNIKKAHAIAELVTKIADIESRLSRSTLPIIANWSLHIELLQLKHQLDFIRSSSFTPEATPVNVNI